MGCYYRNSFPVNGTLSSNGNGNNSSDLADYSYRCNGNGNGGSVADLAGYSYHKGGNANGNGVEEALESLASNEYLAEAVSNLRGLATADLSTLNNRELCKLFRFLSCYFCNL